MRKQFSKFLNLLLVCCLILSATLLTGCNKDKAKDQDKEPKPDIVQEEEEPENTSSTLGIYAHGSSVVDKNGKTTEYRFDNAKNVIDENGNVIIESKNVRQFTAVDEIAMDKKALNVELLGSKIENGDDLVLNEKIVEFVIDVKPKDAINSNLTFKSSDETILIFEPSLNPDMVKETAKTATTVSADQVQVKPEPVPVPSGEKVDADDQLNVDDTLNAGTNSDKSEITLHPGIDGKIHLYATVLYTGFCNVQVHNVLETDVDTLTVSITSREGTVDEIQKEEAKNQSTRSSLTNEVNGTNGTGNVNGVHSVQTNASGANTTGTNATGANAAGTNATGTNAAGANASGTNAAGANGQSGQNQSGSATGANGGTQTSAADGHTHKFTEKVIEPTVRTQGYTLFTCEVCGYSYRSNYTPKTAHTHDYENTVVPATYTSRGYTRHTCKICGQSYTDNETPMLQCQHERTIDKVVPATCTEGGYTEHICENCKKTWTDSKTSPKGHQYDQGKITKQPTCQEEGERTYTCANDATHVSVEKVPKIDHIYDEGVVKKEPTCLEPGEKVYTCTMCKNTKTETIPALGHADPQTRVKTQPTCSANGVQETYCPRCNAILGTEPINRVEHQPSPTKKDVKAATCTEDGYTGDVVCKLCGTVLTPGTKIPSKGGHSYGSWVVTKQATCTAEGSRSQTCSVCQHVNTESIPKTEHSLDSGTVTKPASCGVDGTIVFRCTNCKQVIRTDTIPKTNNHTLETRNAKEASCTVAGYTGDQVCTVCGQTISYGQSIPATGHSYGSNNIVQPATCTQPGSITKTCTVCGTTTTDPIPANGHSPTITGVVNATCVSPGYTGDTICSVCQEVIAYGSSTSALGHDYQLITDINDVDYVEGYSLYRCSRCLDQYWADSQGNEFLEKPQPMQVG